MYDDLTYAINGGLFAVSNALGNIWAEEIYEKALEIELQGRGLRVERQHEFEVFYFDKRVGTYRIDLLVEDKVIVELKAIPKLLPLHRAQLLSYLKGYDKPLGILANFGQSAVEHYTQPNQMHQKAPLCDHFDYDKLTLKDKTRIKDLLCMANRILTTLGAGYWHQVYRRAFAHELRTAHVEFEAVNEVTAHYQQQRVGAKEVHFFKIGDLLLSAVAVQTLDGIVLSRFRKYLSHLHCQRGLIFNFNATTLDFRYIDVSYMDIF